jgi:cell division protein FtsB
MSYSLNNRYRRRAQEQMMAVVMMIVVIGLCFGLGFWLGKQTGVQGYNAMRTQVEQMTAERETLQNTITELRAQTQTANTRYQQLQTTYQEILPEGPLRDLVVMLKAQLDEGRDPERLAFLIRSARPPRNCTEPETRRFVVTTPAYDGPESVISLAEGALKIKASGASAISADGKPEAWYDPSKTVTLEFTGEGGAPESKTGIMPINHSVVVGAREFRLTIAEGARSFAKVTFDSCDYP